MCNLSTHFQVQTQADGWYGGDPGAGSRRYRYLWIKLLLPQLLAIIRNIERNAKCFVTVTKRLDDEINEEDMGGASNSYGGDVQGLSRK